MGMVNEEQEPSLTRSDLTLPHLLSPVCHIRDGNMDVTGTGAGKGYGDMENCVGSCACVYSNARVCV